MIFNFSDFSQIDKISNLKKSKIVGNSWKGLKLWVIDFCSNFKSKSCEKKLELGILKILKCFKLWFFWIIIFFVNFPSMKKKIKVKIFLIGQKKSIKKKSFSDQGEKRLCLRSPLIFFEVCERFADLRFSGKNFFFSFESCQRRF